MHPLRQYLAILGMNLAGVGERIGPVLTILIGVTCAVGVLVSMLAMGTGARRQAMGNVRADRVVIMSTGALSPMQSSISKQVASSIQDIPTIRRSHANQPVAVSMALIIMEARKKPDDTRIHFPLLGVTTGIIDLQPEMVLTAGRLFRPGLHELIAANACERQYKGFEIGDKRSIRGSEWSVVGYFNLGRSQGQCIVYADAETVLSAFGIANYNQIVVMLQSPADYDNFIKSLRDNPTFHVEAKHESVVVENQFKQFNGILNFASYFVGIIMAIGATLGAVNSLYAIVDARRRELATLRAIGFGAGAVVLSIMSESILLALPGALFGGGLAWLFFNGLSASPFGFSFQLAVTPSLVAMGVMWALAMGAAGGLLPAFRAAHVPVTTALRAV
jgi:putative ABC transport system permease protein